MEENRNRAEAERCLAVAEKLLIARDLAGSKKFALRAQESDPLLDGTDQILAVADVLLAAEKRINNHLDWYAILQLDLQSSDLELIKKQYRKLALILHPDKNKWVFADNAFKLVSDAWAVLSNPSKKSLYDNEINLFSNFDSIASKNEQQQQQEKLAVRRSSRNKSRKTEDEQKCSSVNQSSQISSFWTACPYCFILYEYPRVYEECCLRCQNCQRAFHASEIQSPPPEIFGKEENSCSWGFFPLGFSMPNSQSGKNPDFSNWMSITSMFPGPEQEEKQNTNTEALKTGFDDQDSLVEVSDDSGDSSPEWGSRKKGRIGNAKQRASSKRNLKKSQAVKSKKGDQRGSESLQEGSVVQGGQGVPTIGKPQTRNRKTVAKDTSTQMGEGAENKKLETRSAQEWGKPDLNVAFSNEGGEEPTFAMSEGMGTGSGNEYPTEGIDFLEGLDDILGSLPILSTLQNEKVKATLFGK